MKTYRSLVSQFRQAMAQEDSAGFTIVELLVSIVVAAVLLSSINNVYTSQVYLSERVRDTILANAYVEGKVESLRSAGFLSLTNGTSNIASELPSELNSPSGTLTVSSQTAAVKRIVISVSYNEQGTSRTFTYTTLLGELGVGQQ